MKRMEELVKILNEASKAYYQEDREIMSNFDYDKLYDELLELEKESGIVLENSPSKTVGYEIISALEKVRHETRMLSLDKTKDIHELISFVGDTESVLSWKLDGLTIVLKYNEGKFVQAVTRGNGEIGEDVSHNAIHFINVPHEIPYKGELTLRGEAVISYKDFEKINSQLPEEEKYKNPRNLCSGTVRQLDSKIAARRNVRFFAFTIVNELDIFKDKKSNGLDWAEEQGFKHVGYNIVDSSNISQIVDEYEKNVANYEIPSDGLVITYNSISYSKSLGETSKFPRDSLAFKWEDEEKETVLKEIIWNTSRTGLINPIAVFEPVELEGTTVNRASVHNLSIVEELQLGIGDTITVYKANMIIPQIADNLSRSNTFEVPKNCSVCGGITEIEEKTGIKFLYCTNPNCAAQISKSLVHFTSRDAMNIEGLSEATIEKFIELKYLSNYMDIYSLYKKADELKELKGFGEKSINNLIDAIENSKNVNLENFIYALGIRNIGLANARLLTAHFDYDIEKIINSTIDELLEIHGFGEIMARSIVDYFLVEKNIELIREALDILNIERPEAQIGSKLEDLSFVITGSLVNFTNRRELQDYIEQRGGKTTSAVTGNTNYLINNDILSGSSKNKRAKELGIPIINEEEFMERFGD